MLFPSLNSCFLYKIIKIFRWLFRGSLLKLKSGCFYFKTTSGHLYFLAPGLLLGPQSWPPICIYRPCQSGAWACIYQHCPPPPPICIYWSCPTIFITALWICIYLLIYSSSSASSNISNRSNFLGLDNVNISMPILVN